MWGQWVGCKRGGHGGSSAGADQVHAGKLMHAKRVAGSRAFMDEMPREPFEMDILVGLDQLGLMLMPWRRCSITKTTWYRGF